MSSEKRFLTEKKLRLDDIFFDFHLVIKFAFRTIACGVEDNDQVSKKPAFLRVSEFDIERILPARQMFLHR
jgi:hypothetical protein